MSHVKSDRCVEVPSVLKTQARGSYFGLPGVCFEMVPLLLTVSFIAEKDVQTVWDGESRGRTERRTLHSHRPVQEGQILV